MDVIVKCGREEYTLNKKDVIFFNGACYQIITREISRGWDKYSPRLAIRLAKQLIKEGKLKEYKPSNAPYYGEGYKYYRLSETS